MNKNYKTERLCKINKITCRQQKAYRNRAALIFKPLLRVEVEQLPPGQEGVVAVQVDVLQPRQFCTLSDGW